MEYFDLVFFILDFQKQVHKKSHQDSDTQGMNKNRVEKDKKFYWKFLLFYIFNEEI